MWTLRPFSGSRSFLASEKYFSQDRQTDRQTDRHVVMHFEDIRVVVVGMAVEPMQGMCLSKFE